MARIAYARVFNGTTDYLQMELGTMGVGISAMTIASIIKPVDAATFRDLLVVEEVDVALFSFGLGTQHELYFYDGTTLAQSVIDFATAANGWQLVAVTKVAGSAVPRWHRYIYRTGVWTHVDDETTLATPTTPAVADVYIGGQTSFNGMIACQAYWPNLALSDIQLEGMPFTLPSWHAQLPTALWVLNQHPITLFTVVEDRVGTSDQSGGVGALTANAISDLPFDVPTLEEQRQPVIQAYGRVRGG